ncbi:hypothetical protein KAR91_65485 [Candidatus Pacearchaeota archaeon]|nr:hypothetical protein [Candidatus Pacearchaeota archaeon]
MFNMLITAYGKIRDLKGEVAYLEAVITDLQERLSRKPKIKTAQVQLIFEFDLEEVENASIRM